jgi:hypothetical protein
LKLARSSKYTAWIDCLGINIGHYLPFIIGQFKQNANIFMGVGMFMAKKCHPLGLLSFNAL